ncbi:MAG: hypothetical protein Q4F31_10300 [Eubacteriales bacterium]|nr:hypothetical protein [Eubacteriales bacterium]
MEKYTKEELLEQLKLNGVSDEDLAKIAGGEDSINQACWDHCIKVSTYEICENICSRY